MLKQLLPGKSTLQKTWDAAKYNSAGQEENPEGGAMLNTSLITETIHSEYW